MTPRLCLLCGGQGHIIEEDLASPLCPPVDRSLLFQEGRTEVCPRCLGDGREAMPPSYAWRPWALLGLLAFACGVFLFMLYTGRIP